MKKEFLIFLFLIFITGCTKTMVSTIGPSDNIQPNKILCDQNNLCPVGYSCNIFRDFENKPVCWRGYDDPCDRCPSKQCDILESFPPQIICR